MNRRNPFPGMDPWLELRWPDVHTRLIAFIATALGRRLPDDLVARAEENVTLSSGGRFRSDAAIEAEPDAWKSGERPTWTPEPGGPEATTPVFVAVEEVVERWLEILTLDGTLVTIIEILSSANKLVNRGQYLQKRKHYLREAVNLVEIDLLRGGESVFELPIDSSGQPVRTSYAVCVKRRCIINRREVYPIGLREKLPVISIPLREEDADVTIDLQELINEVYETGRYGKTNYGQPLSPALDPGDDTWVRETLREAGLSPEGS